MSKELVHILNEEIRKSKIKAIGFDLDGTLTDLQKDEIQNLIGDRTLKLLPDDLKKALGETSFARLSRQVKVPVGWYLDLKTGYLLQPNPNGRVIKARRGKEELSDKVISEEYGTKIELSYSLDMNIQKRRFMPICDGFDYVEGVITASLAAMHGLPKKKTLAGIAVAVRKAHDDAQRGFKAELLRQPEKYGIGSSDNLIKFFDELKASGYKIFLLTASKKKHAIRLLEILGLTGKGYFEQTGKRYFDKILTKVTKPECFYVGTKQNSRLLQTLRSMGVHSPSEVLYIGDHLYKDILLAHRYGFRTCLRMPRTYIDTVERKLNKYGGVRFRDEDSLRIASGHPSEKQIPELGNYYYEMHRHTHMLVPKLHYLRQVLLH